MTAAVFPVRFKMEHTGFEPVASTMRMLRAPNCANAPYRQYTILFFKCKFFLSAFRILPEYLLYLIDFYVIIETDADILPAAFVYTETIKE